MSLGLVSISSLYIEPFVGLIGEHPVEVINLVDGVPSDMEGLEIEDIGDDIDEFGFEVCGYVFILVFSLEAVISPGVKELGVDVVDNLFYSVREVF